MKIIGLLFATPLLWLMFLWVSEKLVLRGQKHSKDKQVLELEVKAILGLSVILTMAFWALLIWFEYI